MTARHAPSVALRTRGEWLRHLARQGAQVALADALIALLVAPAHGNPFGLVMVYAQAIGLLSWALIAIGRQLLFHHDPAKLMRSRAGLALIVGACALGYAGGTAIGDLACGCSSWHDWSAHPRGLAANLVMAAVFATLVVGWFFVRARAAEHRAQAAAAAHDATLARLVLLQSQLEPHMLFNTLANLRALIGVDAERAQEMLDRLIDFLRATLAASRVARHPLRDEFARVDDYLALMRVRMGERLHATVTLPPALAGVEIPPLLLQPLVENAIKHGLEPQRGAGTLDVRAHVDGAVLVLSVADSGRGLEAAAAARAREPGATGAHAGGFGVVQVRERLRTLHGDAAVFTLAPRPGGGTLAEIRLPYLTPTPPR